MVILIAAERHRMAHGTFADRIEDIDPRFLSRKFLDPFSPTGAPLQYKSDGEGGVIVYSVSHDRKDNGGEKLGIKKWMNNGNDLGFRLRAVSKRGQPAQRDTLPTDVFQEIREENAKDPFHD